MDISYLTFEPSWLAAEFGGPEPYLFLSTDKFFLGLKNFSKILKLKQVTILTNQKIINRVFIVWMVVFNFNVFNYFYIKLINYFLKLIKS